MNCDEGRDKFDAYLDGSLTPQELADLEEHLGACPACAAKAMSRWQMKRAVRAAAAARYAPSPEFRLKIEKSIRPARKGIGLLWLPMVSMATAALVVAMIVFNMARHEDSEQALGELLDMHVATLASANPVDVVSTDRHTVKPWFQGKLPFTFNLPELQNSPYKLVGGKLIYFHHSPGAQLLFELRKHELSVFIVQGNDGGASFGAGQEKTLDEGFNIESWRDRDLHYAVVSDTSAGDVHGLAELLRSAAKP